ncbi:hypothetical protein V6X02_09120 [Spiribacter sp. 1M153]|uniref:hypothetical protein n=1 Tax=Spiribacter roseus TaxID=1855875 RepID=UPI00349F7BDA
MKSSKEPIHPNGPNTRFIHRTAVAVGTALLLGGLSATTANAEDKTEAADTHAFRTVEVSQPAGRVVYWVLPGQRDLAAATFGTPESPKARLEPKMNAVLEGKAPPAMPETLKNAPFMVGIPEAARSVTADGDYVFEKPNAFSDKARIISGEFASSMSDVVREDPAGPPAKTPDSAEFEATFTGPGGHQYRVVLDHVVKPPFPGYETQGGVFTDGYLHGDTGTGTPLMPKQYTHAAWWGLGELYIDGEKIDDHRVMHLMTTEVVRDRDYSLVHTEDLPLEPEERHIPDQAHHTHLMLPPLRGVPGKGPVFDPLPTAYELPNGQSQPFLHIMFEQDELAVTNTSGKTEDS